MSTADRFTLVTFATPAFEDARAGLVRSARKLAGFASSDAWDDARLAASGFGEICPEAQGKRGAGYWVWKPFIIAQALDDPASAEWLLYYDSGTGAGNRMTREIDPLMRWADATNDGILPGVSIPEFGPSSWWTRRDTFIGMGCDDPHHHSLPQVQATFALYRKTERARAFAKAWLDAARRIELVGDGEHAPGAPNLPGFIDHRHDQSILTLLCAQEGVAPFGSPDRRIENSKSIDQAVAEVNGERAYAMAAASRRALSTTARLLPLLGPWLNRRKPLPDLVIELQRRGLNP